jgi:hypothetical protein
LTGGAPLVPVGHGPFSNWLKLGLSPLGQTLAHSSDHRKSLAWCLTSVLALGFGTTAAQQR